MHAQMEKIQKRVEKNKKRKKNQKNKNSAHIPAFLILCSIAFCLKRLIQNYCFHARRALGSVCCLPHECTTWHDTIFHPFHTARSCFALRVGCLLSHSLPIFEKPSCYVPLPGFCWNGFVLEFCFLLTFFSFSGIFEKFWFCTFCLFSIFFANF